VECVVYRLRSRGEKLPPERVKERPEIGRLVFARPSSGEPTMRAHLFDAKGTERDRLISVTIVRIDRGVLIAGWEPTGAAPMRQTWWCVPGPLDEMTAPE
jgi:hypothetical protein